MTYPVALTHFMSLGLSRLSSVLICHAKHPPTTDLPRFCFLLCC